MASSRECFCPYKHAIPPRRVSRLGEIITSRPALAGSYKQALSAVQSRNSLTVRLRRGYGAVTVRLRCVAEAIAVRLRCGYGAVAARLEFGCSLVAVRLRSTVKNRKRSQNQIIAVSLRCLPVVSDR